MNAIFTSTRNVKPLGRKQKGLTIIELSLGLAVVLVLALLALRGWNSMQLTKDVSAGVNTINQVYASAQNWRSSRTSFTGVSMTVLDNLSLTPDAIGDGTGANPWGGDITISAAAGNPSQVTITMDNVPTEAGDNLVDKLQSEGTASFSSGTFSYTR